VRGYSYIPEALAPALFLALTLLLSVSFPFCRKKCEIK
jgi:hypothetical protein